MELWFVGLTLIALLGQSSSNPIDSLLDPLGWFSEDSTSSDSSADASSAASAKTNSIDDTHGRGKGLSASLDAAHSNSFAVDKSLHVPLGKAAGLDANLALAGSDSIALSKGIGKTNNRDNVIILPSPRREYGPPVEIEELPAYVRPGPPRPQPVYLQGPPPPAPRPMPVYHHGERHYEHEPLYNVHDIGSRPAQHY